MNKYKIWVIAQEHIDSHDYNVPLIQSPFVKIWEGEAEDSIQLMNKLDPNMMMYILHVERLKG